ncbi:MAG: hypothetical protein ABIK65_06640 [Candidatus Eisenbacteria bacterium]
MKRNRAVDRLAALAALILAAASVGIGDADKAPLHLLLARALRRIAER